MALQLDIFESAKPTGGITLRPYQREAMTAAQASLKEHGRSLVVMPTGTGKTRLFSALASTWPGRVLALAHRRELIEQMRAAFEQQSGERATIEMASFHAGGERLVCAMVQTLRHDARLRKMASDPPSLIIVDEAHHATAASYRKILDAFPEAKVLGVTATPDRTDEESLGQIFTHCPYRLEIDTAINDGWLVPVDTLVPHGIKLDLSRVSTRAGDLAEDELDEEVTRHLVEMAAGIHKACGDRKTIVFVGKVATAKELVGHLDAVAGRPIAAVVDGEMGDQERAAIIGRGGSFRRGSIRYLVNVGIATEGYDDPECSAVVICRPTKSRALFTQMVGRALRPLAGIVDGKASAAERTYAIAASPKQKCLLVNFYLISGRHTLIGPEDVFGGKYSEEERQLARESTTDEATDLAKRLEGAREQLIERKRRADAEAAERARKAAEWKARNVRVEWGKFDPFATFNVRVDAPVPGDVPADVGQRKDLEKFGIVAPANLTSRQAEHLMRTLRMRQRAGLCRPKQGAVLRRAGIDPTHVSFEAASALIAHLDNNGWRITAEKATEIRERVAKETHPWKGRTT